MFPVCFAADGSVKAFLPIAGGIEDTAYFHHIPENDVDNGVIPYADGIISLRVLPRDRDRLEGQWAGCSFPDGRKDILFQFEGSIRILQMKANVVENFNKLGLKLRQNADAGCLHSS